MWRLLLDQNFDLNLWRGVQQRHKATDLDVVRLLAVGLATAPDEEVLAWAAQEGRILLTHDARTIPPLAYGRIGAGLPMPGVILVQAEAAYDAAINDICLLLLASTPQELVGQVEYLPY